MVQVGGDPMRVGATAVGFVAVLVLGGVLAGCGPRPDRVVTKSADTNDGACNSDCSLREAVVAANAANGPDVIRVPTGFYQLGRVGSGEDASATGDLDIRGDVVIEVEGERSVTVSGHPAFGVEPSDRVLDVHSGTVEVRGAELEGGTAGSGGVIRNNGVLTLVDVRIAGGFADGDGGAIASGMSSSGASLTLRRTTVSFNQNTDEGGGISSRGRLRIEDSTIDHNRGGPGRGMGVDNGGPGEIIDSVIEFNGTRDFGGENCGGGIHNSGTLSVRGSRITNNGGESGGGILNSPTGLLTVVSTQIRYNRSSGSGGGVANDGGRVLLDATTVAGNEGDYDRPRLAADCPSGEFDEGGGLFNSPEGTFELRNTTVAFNEGGLVNDCAGVFVDRGGNTIGDRTGCELRPPA